MNYCKLYISFIFTLLVTIPLFSQSIDLKDGYHVFKYPNESVSSEGYIRNGKPDGYWKSYFVTGVLKSEGKRRNFMLDSVWVFYTQTGDTLEKIDYLMGKKSGYYYKYKTDKIKGLYIWSRELFASDKREGTAYIYFPDGSVKQTIPYLNSKKQGLSKEFDNEKNIITLFEYNNDFLISRERINRKDKEGLKQGEWKTFHENGNIHYEITYRNNLLHGYYKEYNKNGILVVTMLYENGEIVEESIDDDPEIEIVNKYDNNGNLVTSGPYRQNKPVGIHREYNKEGVIIHSFIYNNEGLKMSEGIVNEEGRRNGKWKNYYNDGKIKETGSYLDNRKSGTWKFYNNNGNSVQTGESRNGRVDGRWQWYYPDGSILREEEYYLGKR
ncbi:MAG: hypothetical protein K8S18_10455, partial [Desulfobacula sp.]|nr:hypothetical protein [Desulfobacula sp.]